MPAPPAIQELVQCFDAQRQSYRSAAYKEANLRLEFINPFFEALGWDVANRKGYAEADKDGLTEAEIAVVEQG
jgi:predicted type IV restriction endonuclease